MHSFYASLRVFQIYFQVLKVGVLCTTTKIAIQISPIFRIEHQKVHQSLIKMMQETFA